MVGNEKLHCFGKLRTVAAALKVAVLLEHAYLRLAEFAAKQNQPARLRGQRHGSITVSRG